MTTYYEIKNIVAVLALGSCQEFVCLNGIVFRMLYWPQEFIKVRSLLKIRSVQVTSDFSQAIAFLLLAKKSLDRKKAASL